MKLISSDKGCCVLSYQCLDLKGKHHQRTVKTNELALLYLGKGTAFKARRLEERIKKERRRKKQYM